MYRRSGRFGRKQNKSKVGKDPLKFFSLFNPHTLPAPFHKTSKGEWIQIGSMDPAIYFFGLRCERIYSDGTRETINFSLTNFTKPGDKEIPEVGKENFYYINSTDIIKQYCDEFLKDCHFICIESQLSFNYDMTRLSSYLIATMCCYLKDRGNRPIIVEMDPKLKSRLLGAPPLKGVKVKEWNSAKARELLHEEGDQESLDFMDEMKSSKIKDFDLADVKCQIKVMEILIEAGSLPKIHTKSKIVVVNEEEVKKKKKVIIVKKKE